MAAFVYVRGTGDSKNLKQKVFSPVPDSRTELHFLAVKVMELLFHFSDGRPGNKRGLAGRAGMSGSCPLRKPSQNELHHYCIFT